MRHTPPPCWCCCGWRPWPLPTHAHQLIVDAEADVLLCSVRVAHGVLALHHHQVKVGQNLGALRREGRMEGKRWSLGAQPSRPTPCGRPPLPVAASPCALPVMQRARRTHRPPCSRAPQTHAVISPQSHARPPSLLCVRARRNAEGRTAQGTRRAITDLQELVDRHFLRWARRARVALRSWRPPQGCTCTTEVLPLSPKAGQGSSPPSFAAGHARTQRQAEAPLLLYGMA